MRGVWTLAQPPGAASDFLSSGALSSGSDKSACSYQDRQYHGVFLHRGELPWQIPLCKDLLSYEGRWNYGGCMNTVPVERSTLTKYCFPVTMLLLLITKSLFFWYLDLHTKQYYITNIYLLLYTDDNYT